jgi:hypothetical protein
MGSANQLCGQCHGNLRFAGTDHLTYNIESGTGGIGVADRVTMPGTQCTDCHMHKSDIDGTNSLMFGGHSWSVFIREPDGSTTASCTSCHTEMNADSAISRVARWKAEFASLDSIAQTNVAAADSFMQGNTDSLKLSYLAEAKHNLSFAESDESGGFHNHQYSLALLNDAIAKSAAIVTGIRESDNHVPLTFALDQNYPNPFNPTTTIKYTIPFESKVQLTIFNVLGEAVAIPIDNVENAGYKSFEWNSSSFASGIYFYRLQATSVSAPGRTFTQIRKMVLLK